MTVRVRSRSLRVVRGLVIAVLSVAIAAFSHVAGGGMTPGALGTVLALGFAILTCIALSRRALATVPLAVSVVLSQLVFHLLFSLGTAVPASAAGHHVGMLGMVMSGGVTVQLPGSVTEATAAGSLAGAGHAMVTMSDARMWLGHLAAALVTFALLLHGERGLATVLRVAAARLAVFCRILGFALYPERHPFTVALADRRGVKPRAVLLAARPHRGPPTLV